MNLRNILSTIGGAFTQDDEEKRRLPPMEELHRQQALRALQRRDRNEQRKRGWKQSDDIGTRQSDKLFSDEQRARRDLKALQDASAQSLDRSRQERETVKQEGQDLLQSALEKEAQKNEAKEIQQHFSNLADIRSQGRKREFDEKRELASDDLRKRRELGQAKIDLIGKGIDPDVTELTPPRDKPSWSYAERRRPFTGTADEKRQAAQNRDAANEFIESYKRADPLSPDPMAGYGEGTGNIKQGMPGLSRSPQIGSGSAEGMAEELIGQYVPTPKEAVEEELKKTSLTASVEPAVKPAVEPAVKPDDSGDFSFTENPENVFQDTSDVKTEDELEQRLHEERVVTSEEDLRKRAEEILNQEIEDATKGMSNFQRNRYLRKTGLGNIGIYNTRLKEITNRLGTPGYGTGEMLRLEPGAAGVLKDPGFTSIEDASLRARRDLGINALPRQMEENIDQEVVPTSGQEVVPISEGENAIDQMMSEEGTGAVEGTRTQVGGLVDDSIKGFSADPTRIGARPLSDNTEIGGASGLGFTTDASDPVVEPEPEPEAVAEEPSFLGRIGQMIKDNPEVAAQIAQLGGGLISGAAQDKAQRRADAATQDRMARANLIGALTGRTPGVTAERADTGGLFSLDTLGKAIAGGGKIATGEMERRVQEAERERVAGLEASREEREKAGFKREGEQFDETLAFQHRKLAQDNALERLGLSLEDKKLLQRKEYQNEILRLQRDRLGLDATNMYYEAVARANQANNTKTDEKPLTPSEIAELSGKISTLDEVSRAREKILDAAKDGRLSFLELGPLSLENAPQYIFGSDQAEARQQIKNLINIVAQTLPGNPSDKENQRVEQMLMQMTDRPITIDAIADLYLESHMLSLNNELTGLTKSGYKTGWAYDLLGNYDQRYGEGAEERQFDAYAQQFIQGEGN